MRSSALVPFVSLLVACSAPEPKRPPTASEPVGRTADGRQTTPVNQTLTPHGTFVDLPGLRPQVLARSPDGRWLYTSGKTSELLVLDAATGAVQQRVSLPSDAQQVPPDQRSERELKPDRDGQVSYTGLVVSADGRTIWLANVRGSIKVFTVAEDGSVQPSHSLPLPPAQAPRREAEIPTGLALSPDGGRLYVCANLGNRPPRTRRAQRRSAAHVRRRRGPVRCRAARHTRVRQQSGWAATGPGRRPGPRRPRHHGARRSRPTHRQRRLGQRHRPRHRSAAARDPHRPARERPRRCRPTAPSSSAPTPAATPCRCSTATATCSRRCGCAANRAICCRPRRTRCASTVRANASTSPPAR